MTKSFFTMDDVAFLIIQYAMRFCKMHFVINMCKIFPNVERILYDKIYKSGTICVVGHSNIPRYVQYRQRFEYIEYGFHDYHSRRIQPTSISTSPTKQEDYCSNLTKPCDPQFKEKFIFMGKEWSHVATCRLKSFLSGEFIIWKTSMNTPTDLKHICCRSCTIEPWEESSIVNEIRKKFCIEHVESIRRLSRCSRLQENGYEAIYFYNPDDGHEWKDIVDSPSEFFPSFDVADGKNTPNLLCCFDKLSCHYHIPYINF